MHFPDAMVLVNMTKSAEDPRMALLGQYLTYIISSLGAVVLPFSLFNMYLLYLTDGERRPSHLLYINLLGAGEDLTFDFSDIKIGA